LYILICIVFSILVGLTLNASNIFSSYANQSFSPGFKQ